MSTVIISKIKTYATRKAFPDGRRYHSLAVKDVNRLVKDYGVPGKSVEIEALTNDIIPERYARNLHSLSVADQVALLQSKVCVVGLGGLGGTVVEILARVGIGTLTLIDGDIFEDSNLNRQLLSTENEIGASKARAAEKRVLAINSSIETYCHFKMLNEKSAMAQIQSADVVVDCLDNLKTRFILEDAAKKCNRPLVSAAIGGISGHVTAIFPEDRGLTLIYGKKDDLPAKGAEALLGCLPQAVALIAALECSEVVKICLQQDGVLKNKLLIADLSDNTFETMELV